MREAKRNVMAFDIYKLLIIESIKSKTKVSNTVIQEKLAKLSFELTDSFIKASTTNQ